MKTDRQKVASAASESRLRPGLAGGDARSSAAFSLIELLTVIAIIGFLMAMGIGLTAVASRKSKESRIRAELNNLVTAIEDYRATFGQYPPDNNRGGTNYRPALNSLYYELVGVVVTNQGFSNRSVADTRWFSHIHASNAFGVVGFRNSAEPPQRPKGFLQDVKSSQYREMSFKVGDPPLRVLTPGIDVPVKAKNNIFGSAMDNDAVAKRVNPWRYVSTRPTNNPATFDLWADVVLGTKTIRIGNWKQ